ncbi:MAG: LD-carboxypeptidase [Proteobacteria bacterium]|nr:MAG: LD-carboxypeptidase [Pseudomonadota bacterium]
MIPHPSKRPRALKPGDTLGVVAPASPFDEKSFGAGVKVLESMGFNLHIAEDLFRRNGYLAGTDEGRADRLHRLFTDPAIDGIICARGGYGAMRILPLLDANLIARHPKAFIGFSDITALLTFLVKDCGMTTFHGPTVTTLGDADRSSRDHFYEVLTQAGPLTLISDRPRELCGGSATGMLLAGNLTLLCHLTGTPFQPDLNGCILLIEDRGEAAYRIDRMLTHMLLAGYFDGLAGVVLGSFSDCGGEEAVFRIVTDRLGKLNVPIVAGFDVGHTRSNRCLPVGEVVRLDARTGTLRFCRPAMVPADG